MTEDFEVPSPHEKHLEHVAEHAHALSDTFASKIAVMTAIMATLGALLSYHAGSTESEAAMDKNNAAMKKTEAANQWNYYQAKSSRQASCQNCCCKTSCQAGRYNCCCKTSRQASR